MEAPAVAIGRPAADRLAAPAPTRSEPDEAPGAARRRGRSDWRERAVALTGPTAAGRGPRAATARRSGLTWRPWRESGETARYRAPFRRAWWACRGGAWGRSVAKEMPPRPAYLRYILVCLGASTTCRARRSRIIGVGPRICNVERQWEPSIAFMLTAMRFCAWPRGSARERPHFRLRGPGRGKGG